MELKITKEKVLEAASKCSTAKETLKTLFPECFEEDFIDLRKWAKDIDGWEFGDKSHNSPTIGVEPFGRFFILSSDYNWELSRNTLTPKPKK